MIRVSKSSSIPATLTTTQTYNGEDVKKQLLQDHHDKCYICERVRGTDFEIEHHQSEKYHPELIQEWNNLFLSCRYCNGKKLQHFDNTLNPLTVDIEKEIEQTIDFANKKAVFAIPGHSATTHDETIKLLDRVFNGTHKLRKIKEERFFEYFISVMNRFQALVGLYLKTSTPQNEKAVRDELGIDKEYLGFKYWVIKSNTILASVFADDIIWNKSNK